MLWLGEFGTAAAVLHIVGAAAAGGVIGLERTLHGRAAGFRTYALLCMGASMAMLVPVFPGAAKLMTGSGPAEISRIAQGILTGIGFLGAGVIVKEGFSVRGLTTAASIWTTAIIGILIGTGHYTEACAGVVMVLCILSVLRWLEDRMRKEVFALVKLGIAQGGELPRTAIETLLRESGLRIVEASYGLERSRAVLEYEYLVSGYDPNGTCLLAEMLTERQQVVSFNISLSRD